MASAVLSQRFKDPFSGLSHAFGFLAAAIGSVGLGLTARRDPGTIATVCIYCASIMALYAASSAYHLIRASERMAPWFRKMDHCAIFLFIAGTCTPIFYHAFDGTRRTVMLLVVWAVGVFGIAMRLFWFGAPRWLYTLIYVAMGWTVVVQYKAFVSGVSSEVLSLVMGGGLAYTAGAIIYVLKRPNFQAWRIGFHEIWHIFVLAGSALHFAAIHALVR